MDDAALARMYRLLFQCANRGRDDYKAMVDECFAEFNRLNAAFGIGEPVAVVPYRIAARWLETVRAQIASYSDYGDDFDSGVDYLALLDEERELASLLEDGARALS